MLFLECLMLFKGDLPVIIFGDHTRNIKFVNCPFAVGAEGVKILKPDSSYEPKFFYYFLHTLDVPSRGYSRHFQFLRKFDFPLAPLDQQKRIVAEIEKQFSRLDEAVAALKRIQANLKRYKASVLKAAVEGKLTEEWRRKNLDVEPASELLKRILTDRRKKWEEDYIKKYVAAHGHAPKDDSWKKKYKEPAAPDRRQLPELPEGWVWANVGQLYDIVGGGTPSTNIQKYWNGEIPWITSADIHGLKDIRPRKQITIEGIDNSATNLVPDKSIIVVTRVGLGKVALTKLPLCFSQDSQALVNNRSLLFHDYSLYYLSKAVQVFKHEHRGTTIAGVTKKQLAELKIALPSLAEQRIIVQEIERRFSVEEEIETNIEINLLRAEHLRQSILKKAFLGKLITHDVNYYQKI